MCDLRGHVYTESGINAPLGINGPLGDAGGVVEALGGEPIDTRPTVARITECARRLSAARHHNEQFL